MDGNNGLPELQKLKERLEKTHLPAPLLERAQQELERASLSLRYGGNLTQLDVTEKYLDWITSLPWDAKTQDNLDIQKVKAVLDKNHFGLDKIKQRVIEYLSLVILQRQKLGDEAFHAPSLFFVGLVGTGKTTFAQSVAEALGRKFVRIPFGGVSSALDLRGVSKVTPEAEPGHVIKALRRVGSKNPVILLDELDRIVPESRIAIMGVLVELLDPEQNANYIDHFIDYPFDLSQTIFIATANNTNNISTAVLDRLEVIQMPSYTDEEKIAIGKQFVLPRYMKTVGLTSENLKIDDNVWAKITRPLGFDAGVRTLERTIEGIVRKVAYKMVSGQGTNFTITEENLKDFL